MPVVPTYPGVYIEELPSGVRTISGVATSVAAFVDNFSRGPKDRATRIFSFADFQREFGGLSKDSEASYAIQQFYLNGGGQAWVVRVVGAGGAPATTALSNTIGGGAALSLTARNDGVWGNSLRARVDIIGTAAGEFNLTLSEVQTVNGRASVVRQEVFRNLSTDSTKVNHVDKVINDALSGSKIAMVTASTVNAPLSNGTLGADIGAATLAIAANAQFKITISDGTTSSVFDNVAVTLAVGAQPLTAVAAALEAGIRAASPANPAFAGAAVRLIGNRLLVTAGGSTARNTVVFANAGGGSTFAADAKLFGAGATANLQEYLFGVAAIASTAQAAGGIAGNDGALPTGAQLIGNLASKTGLYALEDADIFNLLCIPRAAGLNAANMQAVVTAAEVYCETRRAFLLVDTPLNTDELAEITAWIGGNAGLRHRNAAMYYPRIKIPDPLDDMRLRTVGASGTVAGVYARTDGSRGVWKAPAGTEATVRNVPELDDALTDAENGALNPLGVNSLRNLPVFGNVVWGARTLDGSDQQASEWKYVPVRRMALFIEESLFRGLKWVVFEPNDEPLWSQIRLNVGAFMQNLFRQGAFQGKTPRDAYFVKCDSETTTQNDINSGIVNIIVGFAPLKPAEFVIVKLQQMAGQVQA